MLLCSCMFLLCPAMHMIFLTITLADVFSGPFEARRSRGTYREAPASLLAVAPGTQSWRIWMRQSVPGERHHEATWRKKTTVIPVYKLQCPACALAAFQHQPTRIRNFFIAAGLSEELFSTCLERQRWNIIAAQELEAVMRQTRTGKAFFDDLIPGGGSSLWSWCTGTGHFPFIIEAMDLQPGAPAL